MAWLKEGGSFISHEEADAMIDRYQQASPGTIKSIYFDKAKILRLLDRVTAEGVSVFFAKNEDGSNTVALKAIDGEGNILKDVAVLEVGTPCPPYCPK
ncbi:MAG: hypothetical protein QM762_12375 [Chryseolinea sp.]